jgi:hypothetical protein
MDHMGNQNHKTLDERAPEVRKRKVRAKNLIGKSKDELVEIILRLEARFSRLEAEFEKSETRVLATSEAYAPNLGSLSFTTYPGVDRYLRLPRNSVPKDRNIADTTWRFILVSSDPRHEPLGLEIYDDVVVGRTAAIDKTPGLNLSKYDADRYGVSRRHALLRPSKYSLFLIDVGSKNGTFCNAVRLGVGTAHRIKENDVISFSKLHFKFQLVSRPGPN